MPTTLIYDDECAVCRAGMGWFAARADRARLVCLGRNMPERQRQFPQLDDVQYQGAMQVIGADGRIHSGAAAIAYALQQLPQWYWRASGVLLAFPAILIVARPLYRWFARNRYRFGKIACENNRCQIPK